MMSDAADATMYPRVRSVEEVENLVQRLRFSAAQSGMGYDGSFELLWLGKR